MYITYIGNKDKFAVDPPNKQIYIRNNEVERVKAHLI